MKGLHAVLFEMLVGDGEDLDEVQVDRRLRGKITGALTVVHGHSCGYGLLNSGLEQIGGQAATAIISAHTEHFRLDHFPTIRIPAEQIDPLVGVLGDLHDAVELFVGPVELLLLRVRLVVVAHPKAQERSHNLPRVPFNALEGEARVQALPTEMLQGLTLSQIQRRV